MPVQDAKAQDEQERTRRALAHIVAGYEAALSELEPGDRWFLTCHRELRLARLAAQRPALQALAPAAQATSPARRPRAATHLRP